MGSLFSKLFSKKSAEGSAKAPTPPAAVPAQPPPGTPAANLPHLNRQPGPGTPKLQVPAGTTPSAGGIKIPKKRITQRITVTPGSGPASAIPAPGLAPSPQMSPGMPTLKIAIPGARGAVAPQAPSPVATTAISAPVEASLQMPLHTLVKALPQEALRVDQNTFLQSPEAQEMASLPLANILAMLPSGKIDWSARELVSFLPPHLVATPDEVPEGLNVSLPLASVVGRIPPEYLALRPDQRSVDPAVTAMADPFSQEVLAKLAAEAAAKHEAETASKAAPEPPAPPAPAPVPQVPTQPALRPVPKSSIGAAARVTQVSPILPPAPLPSFSAPAPAPSPVAPLRPPVPAPEPAPAAFKFDLPPPKPASAPVPEPEPPAEAESIAEPAPVPEEKAEEAAEPDLGALAQSDSFRALLEKANAEAEQEVQAGEPVAEAEPEEPIAEKAESAPEADEAPVPTEPELEPESEPVAVEEPVAPEPVPAAFESKEAAPEEPEPLSEPEPEPEPVAAEPEPGPVAEVPEPAPEKPSESFAAPFKRMAELDAEKEKTEAAAKTEIKEEKEETVSQFTPPPIPPPPAPLIPSFSAPEPLVPPAPVKEPEIPTVETVEVVPAAESVPEFKAPEPEVAEAPSLPETVETPVEPEPEPEPVAAEPVSKFEPVFEPAPVPAPAKAPEPEIEPAPAIRTPLPPLQPMSVIRPSMVPLSPFKKPAEAAKAGAPESGEGKKEIRISLNRGTVEDFVKIAGVTPRLARKILAWRELHGDFTELSQLLGIPGLTQEIYRQFTGDPDSDTAISAKINLLLGLPLDKKLAIKDIAAHIRRWPSISGCIIAGSEGLVIAKDMVDPELSQSLAAFLPKIMQNLNDTLGQIKALPAEEVHIGTEEVGFFIYRKKGIFLVMLSTEKDLPEYYGKVVRSILHELTEGKITRVDL